MGTLCLAHHVFFPRSTDVCLERLVQAYIKRLNLAHAATWDKYMRFVVFFKIGMDVIFEVGLERVQHQ